MTGEPLQQAAEVIRRLATAQEYIALPDADLLAHFNRDHDHAAFEVLVRRHGPMILGICRRMLSNSADVEDAFQAVFLVLLRKASSIKRPKLLANWLFGVAYHTARAARVANQKRRAKEDAVIPKQMDPVTDDLHELTEILDEELAHLPQAHRDVLLLCDLQEVSRKEAANKLNIAEGTLSSRLSRARSMLAARLKRRGIQSSLPVIATGFSSVAAPVTVPPALIQVAVHAGLAGSAGAAGGASMQAIKLSEAVIKMMLLSKLKILVPAIVLLIGLCAGWQALAAFGTGVGSGESNVAVMPVDRQPQTAAGVKALIKQSTEAIALIEDEELRLDLLVKLGWTQFRLGERAEALATGRQALSIAQALVNDDRKANALCDIAGLLLESGDRKGGLETYQLAEALENKLKKPRVEGEPVSYSVGRGSLAQLCAHGEFEEVLRVAATSEDRREQLSALSNLANSAGYVHKKNKSSTVLQALRNAREQAKKLNDNGYILGELAVAFARAGQIQEAMHTLDLISKPGLNNFSRINATCNIVRVLSNARDWQTALKIYDSMQPRTDPELLVGIAAAQIKAGKREDAKAIVQKLYAVANASTGESAPSNGSRAGTDEQGALRGRRSGSSLGFDQPSRLLAKLGVLEAKLSDFPAALETTLGLPASREKAEALLEIAKLQRKAGDMLEARKTLRKASRAASAIKLILPQRAGRSQRGLARVGTDTFPRDYLLQRIAREQAAIKDLEGVDETLDEIVTGDLKGPAIEVELKAIGGDFEKAKTLLTAIKKSTKKGHALETLASLMTKAGKEEAALTLANQQTAPAMKTYALLGVLSAKLPAESAED